jgi:peptidoglycan/LPS O-acetylase OafA/YrhL
MAALAVLFHHSYASFLEEASRQSFLGAAAWLPMDLGKRGVELFLVISGFCIHMGYARARSRSQDVRLDFVRFWKRRLLRLYPPYLASMVLSLSVGILYATMRARREGLPLWPPDPYGSGAWLGADILTHLLMIHIFFYPFSGGLYNGVFWSLALEEQLYALYFPLRSLFRHLNVWRAMGAVTLMCLAFRALGLIDWPFPWFTQGPARWIEWSLGAVALEVFVGRAALPRILRSPLTTAAVLCLAVQCEYSWMIAHPALKVISSPLWGLGFFCLMNAAVHRETVGGIRSLPARLLARVGVWSYSLYLIHIPALMLSRGILRASGLDDHFLLFHLGCPIFALVLAWLFFQVVEKPCWEASRRIRQEDTAAVQVTPAPATVT